MTIDFDARVRELGIVLPELPKSVANYVPTVSVGNLLVVSGQLCLDGSGKLVAKGQVGAGAAKDEAIAAARASAINVLAQMR